MKGRYYPLWLYTGTGFFLIVLLSAFFVGCEQRSLNGNNSGSTNTVADHRADERPSVAEWRESERLIAVLSEEREKKTKEILELNNQLRKVHVSLVKVEWERNQLAEKMEVLELEKVKHFYDDSVVPDRVSIIAVNKPLSLIVLRAGRDRGVKPGLTYTLLHDSRVLGTARVVDVRERISGAVIESLYSDQWPDKEDRAVLGLKEGH